MIKKLEDTIIIHNIVALKKLSKQEYQLLKALIITKTERVSKIELIHKKCKDGEMYEYRIKSFVYTDSNNLTTDYVYTDIDSINVVIAGFDYNQAKSAIVNVFTSGSSNINKYLKKLKA